MRRTHQWGETLVPIVPLCDAGWAEGRVMQRRCPQGYRIHVPEASRHCPQETARLTLQYNEDGMRETPFLDSMPPRSWYFPIEW